MRYSTLLALLLSASAVAQQTDKAALAAQTVKLRQMLAQSPRLPLQLTEFAVQKPSPTWALEMVSSVTSDAKGVIYLLQRGDKADPVVAVDKQGRVLRSWGRGLYNIPHSIRIDPQGNVWTVDAGSSVVLKFTPDGKQLLRIEVGGMPNRPGSGFRGTTDIAFTKDGRIFISDGYGNNRILEYNNQGTRAREWGTEGTGPGQFHLPHGITIDDQNTIWIADRENGRIQHFDLNGKFLSQIEGLGKTFSVTYSAGALFAGCQPREEPNGAPGWLMKIDRTNGKVIGYVDSTGHHSIEVTKDGELFTGTRPDKVLWFRKTVK